MQRLTDKQFEAMLPYLIFVVWITEYENYYDECYFYRNILLTRKQLKIFEAAYTKYNSDDKYAKDIELEMPPYPTYTEAYKLAKYIDDQYTAWLDKLEQ